MEKASQAQSRSFVTDWTQLCAFVHVCSLHVTRLWCLLWPLLWGSSRALYLSLDTNTQYTDSLCLFTHFLFMADSTFIVGFWSVKILYFWLTIFTAEQSPPSTSYIRTQICSFFNNTHGEMCQYIYIFTCILLPVVSFMLSAAKKPSKSLKLSLKSCFVKPFSLSAVGI